MILRYCLSAAALIFLGVCGSQLYPDQEFSLDETTRPTVSVAPPAKELETQTVEDEKESIATVPARVASGRQISPAQWTNGFVTSYREGPIVPEGYLASPVEKELALEIAKLCANEAGLSRISPEDCALIWQVTENHGETNRQRLRWLRSHSRCVSGISEPSRRRRAIGNCRWTRNLGWNTNAPQGWPTNWPAFTAYASRWDQVRRLSMRLVLGVETMRPCNRAPDTWGGNVDRERAARFGFSPVRCRGTINDGYVW